MVVTPRPPVPETDLAPADWLVAQLTGFGAIVRQLVPATFPRFARVLHRPDQGMPDPDAPASWAAVAQRHGTTLHAAAQYDALARGSVDHQPPFGSLDRMTLPALRDVLARHTSTPERCWSALWHGLGSSPRSWQAAPTFHLPHRDYWLFAGTLDALVGLAVDLEHAGMEEEAAAGQLQLTTLGPGPVTPEQQHAFTRASRAHGGVQSPHLWWPEDRTWCVATEIDLDSTVVAGSAALVAEVLAAPDLEAFEVTADTSLMAGADLVNALDPRGR